MKKQLYSIVLFLYFCMGNGTVSAQADYQHLIIYGQSLSVGAQSYPVLSRANVPGNYMLGEQIWINYYNRGPRNALQPLIGKIANQTQNGDTTMYAFSTSGTITAECPLYGTVNHLQQKIGGHFIATSCGTSGMSIEELSKESQTKAYYANDFTGAVTFGKAATAALGKTISCPAIFWMQGENNYAQTGSGLTSGTQSTNDKNAYKQLFLTLKNNMQNDIVSKYGQSEKPVLITYQVGCQYTKGKELSIGMAQLEASNEYADIICAGPVYPMPDRGGHLDPNGYRWFGEILAKVYYKTQVLGEDFRPLQPKEIIRTDNPKQIKIRYHVPAPPLVLDTWTVKQYTNYGFEVYKSGAKQSISSVAIEGDGVLLTCTQDLSGAAIEVAYAGSATSGHGNLRDSDDYPSVFTYLDLDKKDADGNFIFYRKSQGVSYRPTDEPKNQSSQVIYDQPYPLCNWSLAFYYQLQADQDHYVVNFNDDPQPPVSENTLVVNHATAGNIAAEINAALGDREVATIETLAVTGDAYLTYDDCQAIAAKFPTASLKTLDLSSAKFENNTTPNAAANNCGAFNLTTAGGLLVTEVKLPSNLEVIGTRFFLRFPNLITVNLPAGLKTIRANAFYGCNNFILSELPTSLTALGEFAFYQTSVNIGSFPAGITSIPSNCFNPNVTTNPVRAKITSLNMHENITNIATKAFATQTNLTAITVNRATPPETATDAFDGITLSNIDLYIPVGSKANYENVEPWKYMMIRDNAPTGIVYEQANLVSVKYYNMQGVEIPVGARRALPLQPGIYIVKKIYDNNTVKIKKIFHSK
jgi:hypothetical protein